MKHWVLSVAILLLIGVIFVKLRPHKDDIRMEHLTATAHVARCAACHQREAELFLETPHANTLKPASDPDAFAHFSDETASVGGLLAEFSYTVRDGQLLLSGKSLSAPFAVDWMFGSGHHARTPVSVQLNDRDETEVLEHHVTWYTGHGLDLTIDHPRTAGTRRDDAGTLHRHDSATRCFGCHTTELPVSGRKIDFSHILPGLLCAKCHSEATAHAQSMESGQGGPLVNEWRDLTPKQSVAKCAECHRMPFQVNPEELTPQNPGLTRFASIGLLMSRCFQEQETRLDPQGQPVRLDCMTCHDVHRPNLPTPERVNQSCRACHHRKAEHDSDCPQQALSSDCVGCHMPKVQLNSPARFTDHWVRVRRVGDPPALSR